MLPFSKIACTQCRQFAIRSFASAVAASTASTSSNPAYTPPATQLEVNQAASSAGKATRNEDGPESLSIDALPGIRNDLAFDTVAHRSTKQSQSTLAALLHEQRKQITERPVSKRSITAAPTQLYEDVPKLTVILDYGTRSRRLRRSYLKRRSKKRIVAISSPRKGADSHSFEPIIIKPLSEKAAEEVARRMSSRKFGKFASPPSSGHGRKKKPKRRRKSKTVGDSPESPEIKGASGFSKADCERWKTPSGKQGKDTNRFEFGSSCPIIRIWLHGQFRFLRRKDTGNCCSYATAHCKGQRFRR